MQAQTAMALIDARYLQWMARAEPGVPATVPVRGKFWGVLVNALKRSDVRAHIKRLYWYTDQDDQQVLDDQSVRLITPPDADGGLALVRTMARDLQALVERQACDHLIVASDDDRLLSVLEEVKLHGVSVLLVADERALNMVQLQQDDPAWARLLREADRRLILPSAELSGAMNAMPTSAAEQAQLGQQLQGVVQSWWDDQIEDERDELQDALPLMRGLPQEVDRVLLHRAKGVMGRPLNFQEKRSLRELARQAVLGSFAAGEAAPDGG